MGGSLLAQRVRTDVELVARAGLDTETFLGEALGSIGRAVPHVAACIALVDPSTLLLTSTYKFGDLDGRDEHDHEFGLLEYGLPESTSFRTMAADHEVNARGVHADTGGDVARSNRVWDFMIPHFGYTDEARLLARDCDQVWGAVALFRGPDAGPFLETEIALLDSLSTSMAHGMRGGLLTRLAQRAPTEVRGPAVVIVGPDDEIKQLSVGAEDRIVDLMTREGGVAPTAIIGSLVGAARAFATGLAPQPPRSRVRARSGIWLTLHATPLVGADGGLGDVVITIDEARPPEIVPLVVAAFDLSAREREVTRLVLQGVDTKQIAASMHLSSYTVQDHLKSVFEKAGVRSRRELIARVYFDQYVPRMGTDLGADGWFLP